MRHLDGQEQVKSLMTQSKRAVRYQSDYRKEQYEDMRGISAVRGTFRSLLPSR